jgi:hypothetical protein
MFLHIKQILDKTALDLGKDKIEKIYSGYEAV